MNKSCLLLLVFLIIPNYVFGVSTVYVAKSTYFFKHVQTLHNLGWHKTQEGRDNMIKCLLNNGHIEEMTSELARNKYHFEWLENTRGVNRLIIADLGHEVESGLFTVDPLEQCVEIAEYLGERITDLAHYIPNTYDAVGDKDGEPFVIRASNIGGAARFAEHAPNEDELAKYNCLNNLTKRDIATPNSFLYVQQGRVFLVSTKPIGSFEQILYCYNKHYGYPHCIYPNDPLLFYKNWHTKNGYLIPPQDYAYEKTLLVYEPRGNYHFFEVQVVLTHNSLSVLNFLTSNGRTYFPAFGNGNEKIWLEIDCREFLSQLSQTTKSRLSVRGRVLNSGEVQELNLETRFNEACATCSQS